MLIDNTHYYDNESRVTLIVSYFTDSNKTIPLETVRDEEAAVIKQKNFDKSRPKYSDWIQFLRNANDKTLTKDDADPNNFFWEQFFQAYLYFVGLANKSKITPYSDESFLLFLANLPIKLLSRVGSNLLKLSKFGYLQYLPDVDFKSLGTENIDFTPILNLDLSTFTLKDLTPQITEKAADYSAYYPLSLRAGTSAFKINSPYKDNIEKLTNLVDKKDFWTNLNNVLKNNFGIKFLLLNNERYDLTNLISSFSHYDATKTRRNFITSWATNQFREELTKLIFANKSGIQNGIDTPAKLLAVFNQTKTQLLTRLQVALERLQEVDPTITHLPINGGKYTIDQLLQATNKLLDSNLETEEAGAVDQIKALFSNSIYDDDVTKSTKQLEKYKEVLAFLKQLATDQKLTSFKINDQDYSFISLIADIKKQFVDLSQNSFTELQKLVEGKITLSQLKTTYQESLPSSPTQEPNASTSETKSPTQKSTNQNLAIGLGTAGGVVALAGTGGFVYWFVKIRKS